MPFTEQQRRQPMLDGTLQEPKPGDYCFKYYHPMVQKWKAERRWTTAHNIYKDMLKQRPYRVMDEAVAEELAWQVFFQLYVMPYEHEARQRNGDVE